MQYIFKFQLAFITLFICFHNANFLQPELQLNEQGFRKDYTYHKEFDSYYKYHEIPLSWSEALITCSDELSEFFIPDTKLELDKIKTITNSSEMWIGANDKYSRGDFRTINGKPLTEKYVNWKKGKPETTEHGTNCVLMEKEGVYSEAKCFKKYKFICKKTAANIIYDPICNSYDPGFKKSEIDSCYKVHEVPQTWNLAYRTCKNEEASLVTINSEYEAQILMRIFSTYPEKSLPGSFFKKAIHINFSNLLASGYHFTTEGKTLAEAGYDNWAHNQPDTYSTYSQNDKCGSMLRDGTLSEISCSSKALFICEKQSVLNLKYQYTASPVINRPN